MNAPEGDNPFVPSQALQPTPELYEELAGNGMEKLAEATLVHILPIRPGAVIHDNGCGTGSSTAAIVAAISDPAQVSIKATDINEQALEIYRKQATDNKWPAEASQMDSNALSFPDDTFKLSLSNALLFVLPNDGIDAVKETYRTLQPGEIALFNCFGYVPNLGAIQTAARLTRPAGTPVPRQGLEKWSHMDFLQDVVEKGGFDRRKIKTVNSDVYVTTSEVNRYVTMLWSFIGGTSAVGWLESDEENWDKALDIVKEELKKTDGYREVQGGKLELKFIANIVVATK